MNEIIRRHFPASRLPEELRGDLQPDDQVTVYVVREDSSGERHSLDDLFARVRPTFKSRDEVDRYVRQMRDESE